jgi:hypothetical protein
MVSGWRAWLSRVEETLEEEGLSQETITERRPLGRQLTIEFDLSQLLIVVDTLCQLLHCLHVIFLQLNPFL